MPCPLLWEPQCLHEQAEAYRALKISPIGEKANTMCRLAFTLLINREYRPT